jgi:hypothetical protein
MNKKYLTGDHPKTTLVITVKDKMQREKKAILLFDLNDDWFNDIDTPDDIKSFFAGAMFNMLERDKTAEIVTIEAYHMEGKMSIKARTYCPKIRQNATLKTAMQRRDGTYEILN